MAAGALMLPATFNEVLARLDRPTSAITFMAAAPRRVSYAELGARVRGNADHFATLGVTRGERVAIALESDLEHVVALLALMAVGAVPVSVKPRRGSPEEYARNLGALLERHAIRRTYATLPRFAGIAAVAWDPSAESNRSTAIREVDGGDSAFVQFSSGSLGAPKAVPVRHESLMSNLASILEHDGRSPSYLGLNFLPLSHDMGLVGGLLSNLVFQNDLVLSSVQRFLRRPLEIFVHGGTAEPAGVAMPDFALRYLARYLAARRGAPEEMLLAPLRTIYCGAEPISEETIASLLEVGPSFGLRPEALVFCYGLAEATLLVTSHPFGSLAKSFADGPKGRRVANVGRPPRGTELRIREDGHILVRGMGVCHGYLDEPPREGEWLDTGDVGELRGGDLHVTGRARELFIVNGENLFPGDIESFVARVPGVAEPLVMAEDDRFYLLLVPSRDSALDVEDVSAQIGSEFGVVPSAVAVGPSRLVVRTTSGKPMRAATLTELRSRGLLAGHD